jgi:hypothetical protein
MQAKRTALTRVGHGLRCVRKLRLGHRTQIASQIWVARRSLTVSQIVQLAALGIAVDCPAGIARSLMQNAAPSIARGGVCLVGKSITLDGERTYSGPLSISGTRPATVISGAGGFAWFDLDWVG